MAKDWSKAFYNSKAWQECRRAYLSEHPYCERCKAAGMIVPAEHVHHKVWLNRDNIGDPSVTLNPDNLESLCHDCHTREHHVAGDVDKNYFFDSDGNLRACGRGDGSYN